MLLLPETTSPWSPIIDHLELDFSTPQTWTDNAAMTCTSNNTKLGMFKFIMVHTPSSRLNSKSFGYYDVSSGKIKADSFYFNISHIHTLAQAMVPPNVGA
jgi:hypothetical protein